MQNFSSLIFDYVSSGCCQPLDITNNTSLRFIKSKHPVFYLVVNIFILLHF